MAEIPLRGKVLIIDDTPENIQVLMETLKEEYTIVAAINGEKGLQLASQEPPPDIILLDVMMPGIDGYEVCQRLKADERTRHIPVIFITALSDEWDEEKGLTLGAVDYITKPLRPVLIRARVRNHMELKNHRDHLEYLVRKRTQELLITREITIEGLASLAETRDPETGGHIKRTQHYVKLLAENLKNHPGFSAFLDDEVIYLLYLCAPLHDIGKVGVPDSILLKQGKLTNEEFKEMEKHTIFGRDAIRSVERKLGENSFLRYAVDIAWTHHEKWNGKGYPGGLAGEEIPIPGRLMALADVYDALISKRVYKPPFPHEKAISIIAEGRGSHFDPVVADTFLALEKEFRQIALKFADYEEERQMLSSAP